MYLPTGGNKIKFLNVKLFNGLTRLQKVYLHGNECIDEDFLDSNKISLLSQIVSASCRFAELSLEESEMLKQMKEFKIEKCEKYEKTLHEFRQGQEKLINSEVCNASQATVAEITSKAASIAILEAELKTVKAHRDLEISSIKEEFHKVVQLKMQEIEKLSTEMKKKDEVIKKLEAMLKHTNDVNQF